MDFATALVSILTIHLMASISPGPDFVVVSQKTLLQGRRAGIICGVGVCVGLLVHIGYSVAGLTAALEHSVWLTQGIGIFGGSYLVFLGYKSIKGSYSASTAPSIEKENENTGSSAFWSGLIVNIFNPKAAIYFISLFSIIISPSMGPEKLLLVIVSIIAVQMAWYLTFIFIVTIPSIRVKFDSKVYLIDRILGALMLMMGLYMIATYTFG
ncbi:LysE family translocator [Grimontia hollisae]|uniref:Threonine efflux protein n=1 Tax=Grimontia hollisae CIP 101886 TaxID=675812 RepID=D0I6N5_GRIHO|nr:LysE family translocator [Grimontia hollisae]AMG31508.1 LysE family translocator [Grimontia hollisae]EEY72304.1 threonine efflux protein [Grimontia hollisae CIP 101886]STO45468.1 Threonine efflux protein [Grimontia hollisae]STQ76609.1 Threonine efflux protein [Grimontia hollisae]